MLISEIVAKSGLTKDAIRFYEKRQLIKVSRSNSPYNNYKDYSESVLKRLLIIKRFKSAGFTINQIKEILGLIDENHASCHAVALFVEEKILEIDRQIKELQTIKQKLKRGMKKNDPKCTPEILDKNCEAIEILLK